MKLRVGKIEELPEELRAKATPIKNGEEIIGYEVDASGLFAKNSELLGEVKKYKDIAKKIEGLDVEAAKKALTDLAGLEQRRSELDGEIQKALQSASTQHQTELKVREEALASVTGQLDSVLINQTLYDPIVKAKGIPEFVLPAAQKHVKVFVEKGQRVAKIVDENGNPRIDAKSGKFYTPEQLVTDLKADKVYGRAFESSAGSGSGATGDGGGGTGAGGGAFRITSAQARDTRFYQETRAAAEKAGQTVEVVD